MGDGELPSVNPNGVLAGQEFRESHLNRFTDQAAIERAFRLLREHGIRRTAYNVIGFPDQSEQSILDTIRFNRALDPDNVGPMLVRGSIFINATRSKHLPDDQRDLMLALGTYDYENVYKIQKQQGYFQYLSEHARGELLMGLADAWHRRGNMDRANRYFELVTKEVPDTDYAADAKAVMSGKFDLKKLASRTCKGCH